MFKPIIILDITIIACIFPFLIWATIEKDWGYALFFGGVCLSASILGMLTIKTTDEE